MAVHENPTPRRPTSSFRARAITTETLADEMLSSLHLGAKASGFDFIHATRILRQAADATKQSPSPFTFHLDDKKRLTPDRMFGLKRPDKDYKFFALEADRATMPITRSRDGSSIARKLSAYIEMMDARLFRTHLSLPNFFVLFVTVSDRHLASVEELVLHMTHNQGLPWLLLKSEPDYGDPLRTPPPLPHLFDAPFKRAGHPAIKLGDL